jgi:hypothetical protein
VNHDVIYFDHAARYADSSWFARLCYRLWYLPGVPAALKKRAMVVWNRRYTAALPERLKAARYR